MTMEFEIEDIDRRSKVEVVRLGKVKVEEIDNKSKRPTNKRSTGGHMEIE
jgi:hypothetical protein